MLKDDVYVAFPHYSQKRMGLSALGHISDLCDIDVSKLP